MPLDPQTDFCFRKPPSGKLGSGVGLPFGFTYPEVAFSQNAASPTGLFLLRWRRASFPSSPEPQTPSPPQPQLDRARAVNARQRHLQLVHTPHEPPQSREIASSLQASIAYHAAKMA